MKAQKSSNRTLLELKCGMMDASHAFDEVPIVPYWN